jgi:myo-inositol-1(or 4)-monophosphatase
MSKWSKELESAVIAAKMAGQLILDNFEKDIDIIHKSKKELVTEIDLKSQAIIQSMLKKDFPDYDFFAEEGCDDEPICGLTWVVDPLDGTHNYIAGIGNIGVSIALVSEEGFHLGILFFPVKSKLVHAIEGSGAYCNGKLIHVSKNPDLSKSMVAYDNQFYLNSDSLTNFEKIISKVFTVRIFGTASWDMLLVAMGKIDARIWNCTKLVDIAAGCVIVKEAGGCVSDFNFSNITNEPIDVVASNGLIHADLVKALSVI